LGSAWTRVALVTLLGSCARTAADGHSDAGAAAAGASEPPLDRAALDDRVSLYVDAQTQGRREAAVAIGILRGDQTVVIGRGQVSPEVHRPPDGTTVFLLGSITKVMTGILFAEAIEIGFVRADDPAQPLFSDIRLPGRDGRTITLAELATHRSGLPLLFDDWTPNVAQFHELLSRSTLVSAPGERVLYSDVGYALLGEALERVEKKTFAELVSERIAKPLALTHTRIMWENPADLRAQGYDEQWAPVDPKKNVPTLAPCCALEGTVDDLLKSLARKPGRRPFAARPRVPASGYTDCVGNWLDGPCRSRTRVVHSGARCAAAAADNASAARALCSAQSGSLAAARKPLAPNVPHLLAKAGERCAVRRDAEVGVVPIELSR
jgi:CubicO group peptidase (beta-lactamase class C family)